MAANRRKNGSEAAAAVSICPTGAEIQIKEAVIQLSLSALMVSDLAGHITDVNPAFLRLWGYDSRADILGRTLADFVLDGPEAKEMLDQLGRYGAWNGEHIAVCRNGALRVVQHSARLVTDRLGNPLCLASSFLDVTERAEARQSLRASEARYRNIVDAVPVGIILTDQRGNITFYSPQARAMFGVADDQAALGANYRDWIVPGQPQNLACPPSAAPGTELGTELGAEPRADPGATPPVELRLRRADGTEFWAEVAAVILDEGGPADESRHGSLIVVHNVSDRKQAQEALAHYARDLERSNQELEQFAYVASHDLQEPLRMVAAYVQLLAKDYGGQLGADADEYIDFAVDGAKRMQRLIDDLLAYSRVGTRGQAFRPVNCEEVLREVLSSLRLAIEESGATVAAGPLPVVCGDRGQIYQLLQNLLANAIKFRAAVPPAIHVSAELQPAESIQGGSGDQARWLFSVRDNGIGIEPQYNKRIFVIFQRLHSRTHYSGTGIGLAICKKIVERHGGQIWVESAPGYGSTFYFTLPVSALPGAATCAQNHDGTQH